MRGLITHNICEIYYEQFCTKLTIVENKCCLMHCYKFPVWDGIFFSMLSVKIFGNMKKAHYRWIPCYFNPDTNELQGRNKFYDLLIDINLWIDLELLGIEIPIWVECDDNESVDEDGI